MSLAEFLQELVIKDWKFWNENNRLRYSAPQEESNSSVLEQLKQHKSEILQLLQEQPDIFNVYSLSYGQQALWFLWQLAPESHAYNISLPLHICSELNLTAIEEALQILIKRHPLLRTSFSKIVNEPIQQVNQNWEIDLLKIDASTWSKNELKEKVIEAHQTIFDLEKGSIMRVRCFTSSNEEHILLITIHHIACDRLSLGILLQELLQLYQAQQTGIEINLPLIKHSYQDYVNWEKNALAGTQGEKLWNYWQKQLAGNLPILNLSTDRKRFPIQTYNGTSHKFKLSSGLIDRVKEQAKSLGVTFYTILLAVFEVLLYRYTGQEDILVGSPTLGRSQVEFVPIVGYFVNPVVLRAKLSNNPSFEEFLFQVRQTVLEALTHQDYPFPLLVKKLQLDRDSSRSPIFQASFALQQFQQSQNALFLLGDRGEANDDLGGIQLEIFDISQQEGQFDLALEIIENNSSTSGIFKYNTDLFDLATIERMASHFENLLLAVVDNPQQLVSELPLLGAAERQQLLVEWNDTATDYPRDKCIHQLFEQQVEQTPDAVAVVFEDERLTYQELNQRANQLAHHLHSLGVKLEVLVGICVERSIEMVVGLLGILKAGGAYVPLDPTYPPERLSYMLKDSAVDVLLTQHDVMASLPSHSARMLCLDSDWLIIQQQNRENFDSGVGAANLAYVIYTSGSTGQPKGVQIEHKGLCNFLSSMITLPGLIQEDIFNAVTTISFDIAALELFLPLTLGAKVILVPHPIATNADLLLSKLIESKSTVMQATPATWQMLLAGGWSSDHPLKVLCGGEALSAQLAHEILETGSELWNLYGPTEATVWSTICQVETKKTFATNETPLLAIGRPIANTQIYILDPKLQPVPIGVPGELHIGGDGLARGYLNRPELTAEKFIPNPFSNNTSARLYKTGDLARYLPDGNIEFLGRLDQQVKIRGFRIELGEIEAVLSTHPQIRQAIVIATEDSSEHKRLVAYVVFDDESLSTSQLREYLQQKLPNYMVPSVFVTLDTLPLTPNGKVDRKALPTPDGEITRTHEYVAPSTPSEELIANIFASVLNVQNVGIDDNFFELGGHSLLATQLISKVRQAFSIEIPLRALFESSTVAQFDLTLTQLRSQQQGLILPTIEPIEDNTLPVPLSFAQERLWFLNQLEGASATYNIPAAVRITGDLSIPAFQQALAEIVRRHKVLRTSFPTVDGSPTQVIAPDAKMEIHIVDLQQLTTIEREAECTVAIQQEASKPFDLETAPLIRCSLLQLSATEHVVLLTMHHIVSDGWSIGILIQELSILYPAFNLGTPSLLSKLPIQYADFAVWQRQFLSSEVLEKQLNYWQEQLQDAPELLQLPTDRPHPSVQTYQGATQSFLLDTDLAHQVQALSRQSGTTVFMTLCAAFSTLLYRYSGQSDILIGSPIANRNRSEIEPLIGFFVNTLVLRTRFEDNPSFEQLLAQVRKTTLHAYEYQDVPFEQVVEVVKPQRSLSHSPLFQVMFILQNAPLGELALSGITLSELPQENTIAKFDLTLSMSETPDGLVGAWEYNTDLFDRATIERMAGHFENLLSAIVENPQQLVSEIPLLSAAERQQLLVEWNDTATDYPRDKCIHQLFEEQVEQTPDAVAVVFEDEQLTYQQLNHRANQLAHHLQGLGVEPEVLVGICVERSLEMVVGLLGILKAGGAYVPLDPSYPAERLSSMLSDAAVDVLLTQQSLLESLPSYSARVVCLDIDWALIATESGADLENEVQPNNLLYVIYTSGSTGIPKGITLSHCALNNLIQWHLATMAPGVGVLQFASLSFDASFHEIFATWCSGGTLFLIPDNHLLDLDKLVYFIAEKPIQKMILPVALWQQLAEAYGDRPQLFANLIEAVATGEQLQITQQMIDLFTHLDHCKLHNHYGPSETHVVTSYILTESSQRWPIYPPIGQPIANTQTYILDKHLQPVPIGIPGELHIGGDGLARGYLNRPELTAEKFIHNPFSNSKSACLYKTGDLARYRTDGNIEFLGRIDTQVKLRGFRIELGEIEAILNKHPQVSQAVVMCYGAESRKKRLISYLVLVREQAVTSEQLREFLKLKLPEFMIPSAFIFIETLPLTSNGKIDRKSLHALKETLSGENCLFVPPQTPVEEVLIQIWQDTLSIKSIGIHDNFFELGGHSLLAVKLVNQIEKIFALRLSVRQIFQSQTVAQLVDTMTQVVGDRNVIEEIAHTWQEVNELSPEQVQLMLAQLQK
jgi:amino acid adenylation domain-containing protein